MAEWNTRPASVRSAKPALQEDSGSQASLTPVLPTGRAKWVMIVIIYATTLNASFMQSLMNVALDDVATRFQITLSLANWVVLAYAIIAGTMIAMAASLLKRFGLRAVLFASYGCALVGSVLGFVAWNYPVLVGARILQAVATGLTFPLGNDALLTLSPKGKAGVLLSINSGIIGAGLAFSPLVAGLIITYLGLGVLFLVPAAFSLALMAAAARGLHDLYHRQPKRVDMLSVILCVLTLSLFMGGLNEVTHMPLPSGVAMGASLILGAWFVLRQRHLADPLLDLRPLKVRAFTLGETLVMMSYLGSLYLSLLAPLYLEGASGFTPFIAGCLLVVPILCYAALCFASGRILGKHGVWPLVPGGFFITLAAFGVLYFVSQDRSTIGFLICVGAAYAGIGLLFPAVKSVDLEVLPQSLASNGSSIHSTLVQIAGSISSALFVGVMSSDVGTLMVQGASKADAYAAGFSHTLLIAIGIMAAAFIVSLIYAKAVRALR